MYKKNVSPLCHFLSFLSLCFFVFGQNDCAFATEQNMTQQDLEQKVEFSEKAQLTYKYLIFLEKETDFVQSLQSAQTINPASATGSAEDRDVKRKQEKAAQALDNVIEVSPLPELYLEKAALYFNTQQIDTAISIIQEGLEKNQGNKKLFDLLSQAYLVKGNKAMAAEALEQYVLIHPEDTMVKMRLLDLLVHASQYAKVVDQINTMSKKEQSEEVLFLKAQAFSRIGKRKDAINVLKQIVKNNPKHYEALADLAFIYENTAQFQQAIEAYKKLLETEIAPDEVCSRLIILNIKLNDLDNALKIALTGPEDAAFLIKAAKIFLNEEFPAQASAVLDKLKTLDPIPPEYFLYKSAIVYTAEENPEKALEFLDQIDPITPLYAQALVGRIHLLLDLGREEEGKKILQEALRLYPEDLQFILLQIDLLVLDEHYEQAEHVLEDAINIHKTDLNLRYRYGEVLEAQDKREQALNVMEDILAQDPYHVEALNFIGYTLAEENRDLDRALILIETALQHRPKNPAIIDSLAWVLFKQGKLEKAWSTIKKAVQLLKNNAIIWEHYGDIAVANNFKKTAQKGYKKALELDPQNAEILQDKLNAL